MFKILNYLNCYINTMFNTLLCLKYYINCTWLHYCMFNIYYLICDNFFLYVRTGSFNNQLFLFWKTYYQLSPGFLKHRQTIVCFSIHLDKVMQTLHMALLINTLHIIKHYPLNFWIPVFLLISSFRQTKAPDLSRQIILIWILNWLYNWPNLTV